MIYREKVNQVFELIKVGMLLFFAQVSLSIYISLWIKTKKRLLLSLFFAV